MAYLFAIVFTIIPWTQLAEATTDFAIKELIVTDGTNRLKLNRLSSFKNLETLKINCIEDLKELPAELGKLLKLKVLDVDNGNGCSMNVKIPEEIGNLSNLRVLILRGAQDNRDVSRKNSPPRAQLPNSLNKLNNLETLDLSRNGYNEIPAVVSKIKNLKTLKFDFNELKELPAWLTTSNLTKVTLGSYPPISCNKENQKEIANRFPKIQFDFSNEFDCP